MYKVCGWDVGIKNLAYCIIEQNTKDKKIKIDKWGVINLTDDLKKPSCIGQIGKSDKVCGKNAAVFGVKDKEYYYCKTHQGSYSQYVEGDINVEKIEKTNKTNKNKEQKENKEKCEFEGKKTCEIEPTYSVNGKKFCTSHKTATVKKIINDSKLKPIKKQKNCTSLDPQYIATKLTQELDKLNEIFSVDEIVIENQPAFKNPTMKHMASMLYHHFVLRCLHEKETNKSNVKRIKFVAAANKLKINEDKSMEILSGAKKEDNKSKVYKLTKELGIKYTKEILKDKKENLEFLEKHKKKDDLCDAFLLGYHYLLKINS